MKIVPMLGVIAAGAFLLGRVEGLESTPGGSGMQGAAQTPAQDTQAPAAPAPRRRPVTPTRETAQPVRTNADRLHALLAKSVRSRTPKAASPAVGGNRTSPAGKTPAAAHGPTATGIGLSTMRVSNGVTTVAKADIRNASRQSVPRAAVARPAPARRGLARPGGDANSTSVDGTQVHRRF